MAGRKREAKATAEVSNSLPGEYTVFIKKIAYVSVERHRAESRSHTRSSATRNLPILGVSMDTIFTTCENVEFWNRKLEAVSGHSDSSSHSEQSTADVVWRSLEIASRPSSFCDSSGRVSNLRCVRSTDCFLICNFWFNDDGLLMDF
jgi:hypothetical protein